MSVAREIEEAIYVARKTLGWDISEIINQDGDDKTDGEVVDDIIKLLRRYNIYKERQ